MTCRTDAPLKTVLAMASYARGRITDDGAELKGLKASEVVRRGVGHSPKGGDPTAGQGALPRR